MIRAASPADTPRLRQIILHSERSADNATLRAMFRRQRQNLSDVWSAEPSLPSHLYVYDDNGIVKGLICWCTTEPVCTSPLVSDCIYADLCGFEKYSACAVEIRSFFVDPEFRGSGIGKQMLESFLRNMHYQDVRCACIWLYVDDVEMIQFCQSYGFVQSAESSVLESGERVVKYIHQN